MGRYSPCPNPWFSLWNNKDDGFSPHLSLLHRLLNLLFSIEFLKYIKPGLQILMTICIDYIEMHVLLQKQPPYFWAQISSVLLLLGLQACYYLRAQSNLFFAPILMKMHKNCLLPKIKVQDQISHNAY